MECRYDLIERRLFPASNGTGAEGGRPDICLKESLPSEQGIRNWDRIGWACVRVQCSATTQLSSLTC